MESPSRTYHFKTGSPSWRLLVSATDESALVGAAAATATARTASGGGVGDPSAAAICAGVNAACTLATLVGAAVELFAIGATGVWLGSTEGDKTGNEAAATAVVPATGRATKRRSNESTEKPMQISITAAAATRAARRNGGLRRSARHDSCAIPSVIRWAAWP